MPIRRCGFDPNSRAMHPHPTAIRASTHPRLRATATPSWSRTRYRHSHKTVDTRLGCPCTSKDCVRVGVGEGASNGGREMSVSVCDFLGIARSRSHSHSTTTHLLTPFLPVLPPPPRVHVVARHLSFSSLPIAGGEPGRCPVLLLPERTFSSFHPLPLPLRYISAPHPPAQRSS